MNNLNNVSEEDKKKIEQIIKVALSILDLTKNKLLINMRFLDLAIAELKLEAEPIKSIATNGKTIFFNPLYVIHQYVSNGKENGGSLTRVFLHIMMHCIFKHNFSSVALNHRLWDLSCDIAVEASIDNLLFDFLETDKSAAKQHVIKKLTGQINPKTKKKLNFITAEKLYRFFVDSDLSGADIVHLEELFKADDHFLWYKSDADEFGGEGFVLIRDRNGNVVSMGSDGIKSRKNKNSSNTQSSEYLAQHWSHISERMKVDMDTFSKNIGDTAGSFFQNLLEVTREKYDYTSFLKKFAVMDEAMKINQDEFDYIFYTYGMKLYEKMPLIEPLEYKEVKKIKEFAIIIDTSGSVAGKEVQTFLNKTYNILKSTESFFSKINVHIIQCDAKVQEDAKITCQAEFDEYIKKMKIKGLGGTDFRPAIEYVEKLVKAKEFLNLKGVIYFTDGYGEFPKKKPSFETAFVFVKDDYKIPDIPPWAIKLVLQYEDI